jgi:hypothetical protein
VKFICVPPAAAGLATAGSADWSTSMKRANVYPAGRSSTTGVVPCDWSQTSVRSVTGFALTGVGSC